MLELAAQRLLQQMYDALIAPALRLLADAGLADAVQNLVIVPHGLLHQVPFQALHDGRSYLVERFAISYAPSAGVFDLCRQRTLRRGGAALAVAASDAQIPAAVGEAQLVAKRLRGQSADVRLLLEEKATLAAVADLATGCNCLHIACHGLFRGDNPLFSALKLHDGWLTAAQAAQLDLGGALVALSACESGRSQVEGGDEILGLVYGFLSAGAATLLVSQWLVQDEVTAQLMERWYEQLAVATDLAAALRTAQLAIMAEHPHPYYWAPFVLIGQRAAEFSQQED
jgi:CHAT domain-containing protein